MVNVVLSPREAARFISSNSRHVKILPDGIRTVSNKVIEIVRNRKVEVSVNRWKTHELLPQTRDNFALNWVFVSDLLNFSFWTEPNMKYVVNYKNKNWTGYWSLCAAMWRSIEEGFDITDPNIYSKMDMDNMRHIFRSDSGHDMPLLAERLKCLHSAGKVLLEKYDGTFTNLVNGCRSAQELLEKIVDEFESFRDEVSFLNKKLSILKRAQILVADIWSCFGGEGRFNFSDINQITAFADYRVPQVLVWLGALQYSHDLEKLLRNGHMFNYGDAMEVEIRGSTIHCVEVSTNLKHCILQSIVNETNKVLKSVPELQDIQINSITLDNYLWDLRREKEDEMREIPFHRTRCIYY